MVTVLYPHRLNMRLTIRLLYERFIEHTADQDRIVVHDPCSEWGRLVQFKRGEAARAHTRSGLLTGGRSKL